MADSPRRARSNWQVQLTTRIA